MTPLWLLLLSACIVLAVLPDSSEAVTASDFQGPSEVVVTRASNLLSLGDELRPHHVVDVSAYPAPIRAAVAVGSDPGCPARPPYGTVTTVAQINCGGPSLCQYWQADNDRRKPIGPLKGGEVGMMGNAHTGVMYSYRTGNLFSYTFNVSAGHQHYIRAHFIEPPSISGTYQRLFMMTVNSHQVLPHVNITRMAVDPSVAVSVTALYTPSGSTLEVGFVGLTGNAIVSTLEVYDMGQDLATGSVQDPCPPQPPPEATAVLLANLGGPAVCGMVPDDSAAAQSLLTLQGGTAQAWPGSHISSAFSVRLGKELRIMLRVYPSNAYLLRLHVSEPYYAAAGKRVMDVTVDGKLVLVDVDPYALAGHQFSATVLPIAITTGPLQRQLDVVVKATTGQAALSALELFTVARPLPLITPAPPLPLDPKCLVPHPPPGTIATLALINAGGPAICGFASYKNQHMAELAGDAQAQSWIGGDTAVQRSVLQGLGFGFLLEVDPFHNYFFRLHFVEPVWMTVGTRKFDVYVDSELRLSNVDPYALAGERLFVAAPLEFTHDVAAGITSIALTLHATTNVAAIAAVEVYDLGLDEKHKQHAKPWQHCPPLPPVGSSGAVAKINCGGPALCGFDAGSSWADTVGGVDEGAPGAAEGIAYSVRTGAEMTYTFPVTPGYKYLFRLYFSELRFVAPGMRLMNVLLGSTPVLANLDPFAAAGSRQFTSAVREVAFTAPGDMTKAALRFVAVQDYASIAAIELYEIGEKPSAAVKKLPATEQPYKEPELVVTPHKEVIQQAPLPAEEVAKEGAAGEEVFESERPTDLSNEQLPLCEPPKPPEGAAAVVALLNCGGQKLCGLQAGMGPHVRLEGGHEEEWPGAQRHWLHSMHVGKMFSYRFHTLPSTRYLFRLHFAELYWSNPGHRMFDVSIDGHKVLAGVDPLQMANGHMYTDVVREIMHKTAPDSHETTLSFIALRHKASINMLELYELARLNDDADSPDHPGKQEELEPCHPPDTPQGSVRAVALINAGGPDACGYKAGSGWEVSGGSAEAYEHADKSIARSVHWGERFSYSLPVQPHHNYFFRLLFAETFHDAPGKRLMSVQLDTIEVLGRVDPFALTGQKFRTSMVEFEHENGDTAGNVVLSFVGIVDKATVAAIEMWDMGSSLAVVEGEEGCLPKRPSDAAMAVALINCGGPALCGFGGSKDYSGHVSGGADQPWPGYDRSMYSSVHWGRTFTYTFEVATATKYLIRLHFTEVVYSNAGRRLMDVTINGKPAISDLDPVAVTGKRFAATVREIPWEATNDEHLLEITFVGRKDLALVAGLELWDLGPVAVLKVDHPPISTAAGCPVVPPPESKETVALLNCGGPAICGLWADNSHRSVGGVPETWPGSDRSVSHSVVWGRTFSYQFRVKPLHTYLFRLHFSEPQWMMRNARLFNVLVDSEPVLLGLDPYALAGDKMFTTVVREFHHHTDHHVDTVWLTFEKILDLALVSAIELYDLGSSGVGDQNCMIEPPVEAEAVVALINLGGPAICGFQAGEVTENSTFSLVGEARRYPGWEDEVDKSVIQGPDVALSIPARPFHRYLVKVHFIEPEFDMVHRRVMNVMVGSQIALAGLDIFTMAGGHMVPMIKEFSYTTTADETALNLHFQGIIGNAMVAAVEVFLMGVEKPPELPQASCDAPRIPAGAGAVVAQINCGGPAICGYQAGRGGSVHVVGGREQKWKGAEDSVTHSAHVGSHFSYVFSVMQSRTYLIRLHFTEPVHKATHMRLFDVTINGADAMKSVDIYLLSGEKQFQDLVQEFVHTTDPGETFVDVTFHGIQDEALVAAIEMYDMGPSGDDWEEGKKGTSCEYERPPGAHKAVALINAGGPAICGFSASTDYAGAVHGGRDEVWQLGTPSLSHSVRWGEQFTYTLPVQPNRAYLFRLHFTEPYHMSSGSRLMSITLDGQVALNLVDPLALSGGRHFADVVEVIAFETDSESSSHVELRFLGIRDWALVSAIELWDMGDAKDTMDVLAQPEHHGETWHLEPHQWQDHWEEQQQHAQQLEQQAQQARQGQPQQQQETPQPPQPPQPSHDPHHYHEDYHRYRDRYRPDSPHYHRGAYDDHYNYHGEEL